MSDVLAQLAALALKHVARSARAWLLRPDDPAVVVVPDGDPSLAVSLDAGAPVEEPDPDEAAPEPAVAPLFAPEAAELKPIRASVRMNWPAALARYRCSLSSCCFPR
jgi:hypothetical protein